MRHNIPPSIARQITGERRLGGRTFYLMERLGRIGVRVFSPEGGPTGAFRVLHEFNNRVTHNQHIEVLKRMVREAKGSFPAILEYHTHRDSILVITDWIDGHTLADHLRGARSVGNQGEKSISIQTAVLLFRWFADDLCSLHHKWNLVHGDLKPANLVVQRRPNRMVMIDFGSAWLPERTAVRVPGDGDDAKYAAPETHHAGAFVDFRADIFSASTIFFEMLTHEIPYGRSGGKVSRLPPEYVRTYKPPSEVCHWRNQVPDSTWRKIDRVVTTGLQLDPEKRHQSGKAWMRDIHAMRDELLKQNSSDPRSAGTRLESTGLMGWLRRKFG